MKNQLIHLSTNVLQKDMRVRLPKSIISNLDLRAGETKLKIFINKEDGTIILEPIQAAKPEGREENI